MVSNSVQNFKVIGHQEGGFWAQYVPKYVKNGTADGMDPLPTLGWPPGKFFMFHDLDLN